METWTWRHRHGDMDMATWACRHGHGDMELKYETKMQAQAIFLDQFFVCSLCKWKISFVRLSTKKQTEVIPLQTD
jgi:hypothetical protein